MKDIRQSSSTVYNSQWSQYVRWCVLEKLNPLELPIARLADYLTDLFNRGLKPATIEVHRAAISSVLRLTRPFTLEEDVLLRRLIRAMCLQRPKTFKPAPSWQLGVVVRQLMLPPFTIKNSDGKIPIRLLTLKTVFLVAMATAARADELAALSREDHNLSFKQLRSGATECSIRPFAGYYAKNATPEEIPRALSFAGIGHLFGDREPDRLLCLVRAVTLYLKRTADLVRSDCQGRLFLHFRPGIKFRKSHISRWLVETILLTYEHAKWETCKLEGVSGHQVRGMAASWAYGKDTTLTEIRIAVGWKSSSVFAQHYLRDVVTDTPQRSKERTVVAAGQQITC